MQEIAIRVALREQERLGLAEYERFVESVATVAALVTWLPTPDARLVLRGRTAEPARVETVSYGADFEMLVVLDQHAAAVERAAGVVAALIESVRHEHVEDDVAGVAGEIDRLDRSAPRGRSVAERSLRSMLEGARADVLARRTTARVRAASALVRLAEGGAVVTVERIADVLAPVLEETVVDASPESGTGVVVAEPVDGVVDLRDDVDIADLPVPAAAPRSDDEESKQQHDDEKSKSKSKKKKGEKSKDKSKKKDEMSKDKSTKKKDDDKKSKKKKG